MGQCYDVNLCVRFKDEEGAKKALQAKIARAEEEHVAYNLPIHGSRWFDIDKIWDLMALFFGGWEGRFHEQDDWEQKREVSKEGVWLWAGFDASYGWENVMMDAFELLAPHLEDGSEIRIYPDSGCDNGIVINGEVSWI